MKFFNNKIRVVNKFHCKTMQNGIVKKFHSKKMSLSENFIVKNFIVRKCHCQKTSL